MSDLPVKTYPPEFLQAMIADHEAEQAGATTEDSSAVETKGDAMREIKRFDIPRHGNECMHEDPDGEYVQYDDHRAEVERLTAEVKRLKAERDEAVQDEKRLRVLIDHARQDEARWVSWLSRNEEGGRDE